MPMLTRDEIFDKIKSMLPKDAKINDHKFEGANIVLFTENPKFYVACLDSVKKIAKEVKKRIEVRADSTLLLPLENAEEEIRKIVPQEAGITSIDFDSGGCRVLIDAEKPGLVIGKNGETGAQIKERTFWTPEVFRTSPTKSDIVTTIRRILIKRSKERATFLNGVGNRIYTGTKPPTWVRLSAFGGYREVGRSCMLLQTPESRVLFDCGINVASEENAFPFLEAPEFDVSKLDAVVISHAHMDHIGLLPILFKYGYTGPVYCTAPTRALMALLQLDYIDIAQAENKKAPYSSNEIHEEILHTITLDYGEVTDITPDLRITFYEGGHIIGSAVTHVHVGDGVYNLVYSGDIKYVKTRLLDPAWNQFPRCEALILESTYGASQDFQPPIAQAEAEVVRVIKDTIAREGKLLIPVLGVGRSQEIMLLIEELMRKGEIPKIPIYLNGMMWDATAIYTTYPEFLSERVRNQILSREENPLLSSVFTRVGSRAEREAIITGPPCVIMATSGMLTGGPSVEYLKQLCDNPLNAIMFINYQGEGSLGKKIQRGLKQIPVSHQNGRKEVAELRMSVHTVDGFSAHADRNELMNFVGNMHSKPGLIVVNHGEASKCLDLMRSMHKTFRIESVAPRNLETIRLR